MSDSTSPPPAWPISIGDGGSTATVEDLPGLLCAGMADTLVDWGLTGAWTLRAATVRGRIHRSKRTPRQDAFGMGRDESGTWLVLAVADGVSASPQSHLASSVAVEVAVQHVTAALADTEPGAIDWQSCVAEARARVLDLARRVEDDESMDARAASYVMATTLTVAVLPDGADLVGPRPVRVMSFGDTSAWVLRAGGVWDSLTPIKNQGEEIAESGVDALPLEYDAPLILLAGEVGEGEAFFLFSDGVGDPLGDGGGIVGEHLAAAWAEAPTPYVFADWVDFARRTHTDDRTAIGLWPRRRPDDAAAESAESAP